jgi:hypothetical protein
LSWPGFVPAIYVFGRSHGNEVVVRSFFRLRGEGRGGGSSAEFDDEVTKLKRLGGHRLHATFSDGTAGEHDFSALVAETGPMVEPLRDPTYFARVPVNRSLRES